MRSGLILCLCLAGCGSVAPKGGNRAVADREKSLGLVETIATIDNKRVPVYQFMLCDRGKLENREQDIETWLTDPQVCYNPFVDENGGATIYLAIPQAKHAALKSSVGKKAAKFAIVATTGVLVFFGVKFGWRIWGPISSMEEYVRHNSFIKKGKQPTPNGANKATKAVAWFTSGGATTFLATWFIVGDGALSMLHRLWQGGKIYYENGKKVLLQWGRVDGQYRNNEPFLLNNLWLDTKKVASVDDIILGIRNELGCKLSPRYKTENPLLAPAPSS